VDTVQNVFTILLSVVITILFYVIAKCVYFVTINVFFLDALDSVFSIIWCNF